MTFYHPDHLGTNNIITNMGGDIYQYFVNLPYGETMAEQMGTGYFQNVWKFNGKEQDAESGLYYYGARYYDPKVSVWLGVDPHAENYYSWSPYNYATNNPIKFIDLDGRDPIYAKNFWGRVKTIGDDGKKGTGSYLVRGLVARKVKAATKAGNFYTGDLSESGKVMHIPTGQIQINVQQTAKATINSGTTPDSRVENGAHSLYGDANARIWDAGTNVQTQTLPDGSTEKKWEIKPFRIGGKNNQIGGAVSDIEFFWHIHPNGAAPSDGDIQRIRGLRKFGFSGNSFLIDINNDRVTFFNENGTLINVKYDDFQRMGMQEVIK